MEIILAGKMFSAEEALNWGLISKVFKNAKECLNEAIKLGEEISKFPKELTLILKELVLGAENMNLSKGLEFERRMWNSLKKVKNDDFLKIKKYIENEWFFWIFLNFLTSNHIFEI